MECLPALGMYTIPEYAHIIAGVKSIEEKEKEKKRR